jgi:hypothetical protein
VTARNAMNSISTMRFQVLTVTSMNVAVFFIVASCSLVKFTDVSVLLAASITMAIALRRQLAPLKRR